MKKCNTLSAVITLLLAVLLSAGILSGCTGEKTPDETTPENPDTLPPIADNTAQGLLGDGRFSLRCDPDDSFNPYLCTGMTNDLISSLLYEGLFRLDSKLDVIPELCESCTTADGLVFTLTLKSGVTMSDGTEFTAADAAYSVNLARENTRWAGRLRHITECTAGENQTIIIKLDKVNRSLPALLDFPMIGLNCGSDSIPAGTGPYELNKSDMTLRARRAYREYAKLPVDVIYLRVFSDEEITEAFSAGKLDLVRSDPSTGAASFRGNYEARRYTSTILQYLGFNTSSMYLDDTALRRAIGCAVDRKTLISDVFGGSGVSAPLPIPKTVDWYSEEWEDGSEYTYYNLPSALRAIGMRDTDGDKFLEYPIGDGLFDTVYFRMLVNAESENKIAAAQAIAQNLISGGLDVQLEILSWDDFLFRLAEGSYELYYAETALSPDLDLSDLILPEGPLNFGNTGGEQFEGYIDSFLSSSDDETRIRTATNLYAQFTENCPFIPILFREYAVYSHRGAVSGLSPSVSGVFCGADNIKISIN